MTPPAVPGTLRALSIRQPWAALILAGHKTVENRSWPTGWRGTLTVHAGQRIDRTAMRLADEHGITNIPTGAYLGFIDLVGVHHAVHCDACTEWSEPDAWHWVLARPRVLDTPIPARGHLGLYRPPADMARRIGRPESA